MTTLGSVMEAGRGILARRRSGLPAAAANSAAIRIRLNMLNVSEVSFRLEPLEVPYALTEYNERKNTWVKPWRFKQD